MFPEQFADSRSGELVQTRFEVRKFAEGKLRSETVEGWAFVPRRLPPDLRLGEVTEAVFDELIAAERSLARLDGVGEDFPNARLLWAPLAKREAILSSRIEDTIASAAELVTAEMGEKPARDEVNEVSNYVRALEYGLRSELPICLRLIRGMHEQLLSGGVRGSDRSPGHFRDAQNYIGNEEAGFEGARFVPPPPGAPMETCLADLERYANSRKFGLPKLVAIAIMHYQFEAIHPFRDGNGRIGRLLSALSLCRMGLISQPFVYVSGYFEPRRAQYNDLMLAVSTHGQWMPWIKFFMKAVASQSQDAEARIRELRKLRDEYRGALSADNAPGRTYGLIEHIFAHPAITAEFAASLLNVSKPTARSYIDRLVQMGALEDLGRTYRKIWLAPRVLEIIDTPPEAQG